MLLIALMTMYF